MQDILVDTDNPSYLDQTVQYFGAVVCQDSSLYQYETIDGYYIVRSYTMPPLMLADIINQQGYGKVISLISSNSTTMNGYKFMWTAFYMPCHDIDKDGYDDIRIASGNMAAMAELIALP